MPTYEYVCDGCGKEWELEQRISEDPIKKCPKCGKLKARRAISGGNFILKGGGWYADLYSSSGGSKSAASTESTTSTETATPSTEKKSEAKPAKKSKKAKGA